VRRVVADTNVLVSALQFGGKPKELLDLATDGQVDLAISEAIVAETLRVLRDKFERALNVCPECGKHRRISAEEYIELLTDEGSWRELWGNLRSEDPLQFESYPERLTKAIEKAGPATR